MKNNGRNITRKDVIYILLSKSKRCFIIARGAEETLRETYRHHLKKRRDFSENFIKNIEPERPCLFVLERVAAEENVNLLLVWLRILRENRLTSFNSKDLIEQSERLNFDNKKAYEQRKDFDISGITACENCLIPTFKNQTCPNYLSSPSKANDKIPAALSSKIKRKRAFEIRICVSEEEKQAIESNAKELKMQVVNYVRMVAKNPMIRLYNYQAVRDHTKEIGEIRTCLNRLIFTIEATNNYLPKEIETMVNLMYEIFEGENRLLKTLSEQQDRNYEQREPYIIPKGFSL